MFLTRVDLGFLIGLFFRYQYSNLLENGIFMDRPADFLYFLILSCIMLNLINIMVGSALLWEAFSTALTHLWVQYNRQVTVSFFFGIKFPAAYLPLVLLGYSFVSGGDFIGVLMGIIVGHIYWFVKEIWSRRNPRVIEWLRAPKWLELAVNSGRIGRGFKRGNQNEKGETMTKNSFGESRGGYSVHVPKQRMQDQQENAFSILDQKGFSSFSGKGNRVGNISDSD